MKFLAKLVMLLTLCAAAFGTTVTPTNFNVAGVGPKTNTVGQTRVAKGSDGFLRTLISDASGSGSLKFVHCLNTACTSTTTTTVYTGATNSCIDASFPQLNYSLSMFGDLPRIAIQSPMSVSCTPVDPGNDTGVGLIVCGDAECSSHPLTYVGETEGDSFPEVQSITTPGDTTYVMSGRGLIESHHITVSLLLYTCNGGSCGAGSVVAFADSRNSPCILASNMVLGAGSIPVFAYFSSGNSGTVNTADCGTHLNTLHLWSNGSDSVIDSTTLFSNISVAVDASGVPTIATPVATSFGGTIQLGIFNQGGKVTYTWPTQVTSLSATAVSIAPDGFARIAFTYAGANGFTPNPVTQFMTCTNASCSASTSVSVLSNDSAHPLGGFYLSLFTGTVGGQVINNFGARVANCTASTYPNCSYTTANEVLYQIVESTPDFTITASPGGQSVLGGQSGNYTVTITPTGGFTDNVTFGTTGQPAGTPTFTPSTINTQGSTTMAVPTNLGTPSGTSSIVITGTSGSLHHTVTVSLSVLLQKPRFISRKIIDLIDNTPGLDIPIRSKTGKIPFSYTLQEHPTVFTFNNQWVVQTQMVGVSSPSLVDYAPVYPPAPPAGSPATVALPAYVQPIVDSSIPNPSAITVGTPVANQGWFYTDSGYVSHFFNVQGVIGATVATDGSGYTLTANASTTLLCKTAPCPTVVDVSGNVLANNNNVDPLFRGNVATFIDPSGVKLTAFFAGDAYQSVIYTDTMNQVVLTAAETNASSVPPTGPLPTNQYSYADATGKVQRYTVFYQLFYQSTNFGCPGVTEMSRTPVYLPITVTQPDGTFYAITYEIMSGGDTTGRIASVRGPTGGLTRYSYNGVNCADGSTNTLVTTTPDGGSWTSVHTLN